MSDEPEDAEVEEIAEAQDDGFGDKFACVGYGSQVSEIAQAFGNLLVQSLPLTAKDPRLGITLEMLNRLVHQIDPAPKGSRARIGVVKD